MRVAVVGASGVVGETILRVLRERQVPVGEVGLFASRTRGAIRETSAEALEPYDAVFFASSEDASEQFAPPVLRRGGYVIDNSAAFRMAPGVPLVIPEVNSHVVRPEHRLFPVGNCTAIILCVALAPVKNSAGLAGVRVATYQAVSGAGRGALEEFDRGEGGVVRNVVPQIGAIDADGRSGEESKVCDETRKVLELPHLDLDVTCVRVPVRTAHSEAVFFETERRVSAQTLADAFDEAPGVVFHREGIVTPREVEGTDAVHVSRLRACGGNRFQMWICGDQLRKGAATNGVQILEMLIARGANH